MFGKRSSSIRPGQADGKPEGGGPAIAKMPPPGPLPRPEFPQRPAEVARPAMRAEKPPARPSLGRRLVVGREISLTGEIRECEKLVIEGKVTADITDTEALEIAKPGHFRGSAVVRDCEISGVFEGDLDVTGLLKLRAGGRASGRIRYAEVEIERGGKLTGDVDLRGGSRTTAGEAAPVGVRAPQPLPDPPATPKLRLR